MKAASVTLGPVLIIGGASDMGRAIAHRFAAAGHPVQLAARQCARLAPDQADLALRYGVGVTLHELDILESATFPAFIAALPELPALAICVVGLLGEQALSEADPNAARLVMRSNFEGPAMLLGLLANAFAARGSGVLVGVSSVAGERGRASNYVYGAAKAGFTAFLSGLRNRLATQSVHVLTVLPGFVRTRMTEGMKLPPRLTASPEQVAEAIFKAVCKKRDVLYVKPIWRLIMLIIRSIPEKIFKKTRI